MAKDNGIAIKDTDKLAKMNTKPEPEIGEGNCAVIDSDLVGGSLISDLQLKALEYAQSVLGEEQFDNNKEAVESIVDDFKAGVAYQVGQEPNKDVKDITDEDVVKLDKAFKQYFEKKVVDAYAKSSGLDLFIDKASIVNMTPDHPNITDLAFIVADELRKLGYKVEAKTYE